MISKTQFDKSERFKEHKELGSFNTEQFITLMNQQT